MDIIIIPKLLTVLALLPNNSATIRSINYNLEVTVLQQVALDCLSVQQKLRTIIVAERKRPSEIMLNDQVLRKPTHNRGARALMFTVLRYCRYHNI